MWNLLLSALVFSFSKPAPQLPEKTLLPVQPVPTIEACFSPNESCDKKFIQFLESSERSIDVAIYDITHPIIASKIIEKSQKIKVRMIIDARQARSENSLVNLLLSAKVPIRMGTQKGIMHHKFTLIDNKKLETGSFNYTNNGSYSNQENQIYLTEPNIVARYQKQFDEMWQKAKPLESKKLKIDLKKIKRQKRK